MSVAYLSYCLAFIVLNLSFVNAYSHVRSEYDKTESALDTLNEIISSNENDSFKYYSNHEVKANLSRLIYAYLKDKEEIGIALDAIRNLYKKEDFRWVAFYLKSLYSKDRTLENMFYDENYTMEDVFMYDFLKSIAPGPKNAIFVNSISSIFKNANDISVYVPDDNNKVLFLDLLHSTKNRLDDYIDNHFDLAGRCSLVRKGLVKKIMYKGQTIISKKNNPAKKGRFIREQENIERLKDVLGISRPTDSILVKDTSRNREIKLKLLSPFAVFSSGDASFYSLTFFQTGTTLEELILKETESVRRKNYLKDMRLLLDFLYEKGIIWGDMSPRNILVEESDHEICYTILDFEKTTILDRPVLMHERVEHARGPMCVEEFGAICTEQEVVEAFSPYFNPVAWDLSSKDKIPFLHPKGEILAFLKERGMIEPTLGLYNTAESEIMQIRFFQNFSQYANYDSLISVGFRIFHYLGEEYDMKTTEVLLCAKKYDKMLAVVSLLDKFLRVFENKLILQDFEDIVRGAPPSLDQKQNRELDSVAQLIDTLYQAKDSDIYPFHLKRTLANRIQRY